MMRILPLFFRVACAFTLVLLVAACGGGDGGPTNAAPEADAGNDQSVQARATVTLDGTGSTDSDGEIVSYAWSQVSGTPSVRLTGANAARATFQAPDVTAEVTLVFELLVGDDADATDVDRVRIVVTPVPNSAPVASAGSDRRVQEGATVTLDGTGSTDSDGAIVSYAWSQVSGTPSVTLSGADAAQATFQAPDVTVEVTLEFGLEVRDDDGATDDDRVRIVVTPVPNSAPVASAGSDRRVQEGATVTLDGTGSTDSDGTIVSYAWSQVSGTPTVALSGADAAQATFQAPEVTAEVTLEFGLEVRDDDGATDDDRVRITVVPVVQDPPGIIVGDVSGNTASLDAQAEFSVHLNSQPGYDVTIPVASSDPSEGVTETDKLSFTPDNWSQAQQVIVRGTNPNVTNGRQSYVIRLGPSQSGDPLYNGIRIADVPMRGIALGIDPPDPLDVFVTGFEGTLRPVVDYSGSGELSFALKTGAPSAMRIDLGTGSITWTPQANEAGRSYPVGVSVTDGALFVEVTFTVSVVAPIPVQTEVVGDRLTVTDTGTDLNGVSVTVTEPEATGSETRSESPTPLQALSGVAIERIDDPTVLRPLPDHVTPVSDFFVVRGSLDAPVEIRLPIQDIPAGTNLAKVKLFALADATESDLSVWTSVELDLDYEEADGAVTIVVSTVGLGGLYVFGLEADVEPTSGGLQRSEAAPQGDGIQTVELAGGNLTTTQDIRCFYHYRRLRISFWSWERHWHSCNYQGRTIRIDDLGRSASATVWTPGANGADIGHWVAASMRAALRLGMRQNRNIVVKLRRIPPPRDCPGCTIFGQVSPSDGFTALRMNNRRNLSAKVMKSTIAHEFLHHAQWRSRGAGSNLFGVSREMNWLSEGTAKWFEDDVFDADNAYISVERFGRSILETGLAAVPVKTDSRTRPYQRFSFLKLLSARCPGLRDTRYANLFGAGRLDRFGLDTLVQRLGVSSCNFGNHLGARSSLASAIVYYQYATQRHDRISLLEIDEREYFQFTEPSRRLVNRVRLSPSTPPRVLARVGSIAVPAAGAISLWVEGIGTVPDEREVELAVSATRQVVVSLTGAGTLPGATNTIGPPNQQHAWFRSGDRTGHVFPSGSRVPRIFVTIANPSVRNSATVISAELKLRPPLQGDTVITSHQNGDRVNRRVVGIAGRVQGAAQGRARRVALTANGIRSLVALAADGTFAGDVVVSLGENTIVAQAVDATNQPVANEAVVTIQGVASSSTGRNALLPSRVVVVLRWNTDGTDVDLYSTDKNGNTIWYGGRSSGSGSLDFDDTNGYGPEVISYRATTDNVYVNGQFDVDVHYYSGRLPTQYTLDVILNETERGRRRVHGYSSVRPLTVSNSFENGPNGTGPSRFNDVLRVACGADRICSVRSTGLAARGTSGGVAATETRGDIERLARAGNAPGVVVSEGDAGEVVMQTAYEGCEKELAAALIKSPGDVAWTCNADGTKNWGP